MNEELTQTENQPEATTETAPSDTVSQTQEPITQEPAVSQTGEPTPPIDPEAAKEAILADRKKREDACAQEFREGLNAVLAKYNCQVEPMVIFRKGGFETQFDFTAL